MPTNVELEVFGVRDALKELGKLDQKQRWKAIAKVKAAGAPLVSAARQNYPNDPVIRNKYGTSNWSSKGRLGYSKKAADKGVQIQVGGRARGKAYSIVTIVQKNAGASMFDIAGFADGKWSMGKSGDEFIDKLNREYGKAQRGMWRSIKEIRAIGTDAIADALRDVVAETNKKLLVIEKRAA